MSTGLPFENTSTSEESKHNFLQPCLEHDSLPP